MFVPKEASRNKMFHRVTAFQPSSPAASRRPIHQKRTTNYWYHAMFEPKEASRNKMFHRVTAFQPSSPAASRRPIHLHKANNTGENTWLKIIKKWQHYDASHPAGRILLNTDLATPVVIVPWQYSCHEDWNRQGSGNRGYILAESAKIANARERHHDIPASKSVVDLMDDIGASFPS